MPGVVDFIPGTGISQGPNEQDDFSLFFDVDENAIGVVAIFGKAEQSEAHDDHWTPPAGWLPILTDGDALAAVSWPDSSPRATLFGWYRIGPFTGSQVWNCDEDRAIGVVSGVIQCDAPPTAVDWTWDTQRSENLGSASPVTEVDGVGNWPWVTNPGHASVVLWFLAAMANGDANPGNNPGDSHSPSLDIDGMTETLIETDPGGDGLAIMNYYDPFTGPPFTEYGRIYLAYQLTAEGEDVPAPTRSNTWTSAGNTIKTASFMTSPKITFGEAEGTPIVGITCGDNVLNLGPGFDALGDQGEWSSIAPGGYESFTMRITEQLYRENIDALQWGASIEVHLPDDDPLDPNALMWAGTLRKPVPDADGYVTLEAVGWKEILAERDDPLFWSTWAIGNWKPAEQTPWTFTNADSISVSVDVAEVVYSVNKGDDVGAGDIVRAGALVQGHVITSIKGSIYFSITTANYELTLRSIHGPDEPGTEVVEETWTPSVGTTTFDIIPANEQGALVFALERVDGGTIDAARLRARLSALHLRGLADDDDYSVSDGFIELCNQAGLAPDEVTITTKKLGPLWWTSGSWQELANYFGTARGWHWSVWEQNEDGDPIARFGPFFGSTLKWWINAYGEDATCRAELSRLEDVYTHVDVEYTLVGDDTPLHVRVAVDLEDEVSDCATGRIRVFRINLSDPQPDDTIPQQIAEDQAEELAAEDFGGTITLVAAEDAESGGTLHNAAIIRATESIYVRDFENPDGSFGRRFKIYEARYDQMSGITTLRVGRVPVGLARALWNVEQKALRAA